MALVTVCIPAYRSAAFLPKTLRSVRDQTLTDFRAVVSIESEGAAETLDACREFTADPRFELLVNSETLGWSENVAHALDFVDSPFFAILPHDDAWHPAYPSTLFGLLAPRADAVGAYADCYVIGSGHGIRTYDLPEADLRERLLAFFLLGADAYPWRGLTRREVLDRPFPTNEFAGLAVECEWAMHLLKRGQVLHAPKPLFFKNEHDVGTVSVGWRTTMPLETLERGLEHHSSVMLSGLRDAIPEEPDDGALILAAEAAMLWRWALFTNGRVQLSVSRLQHIARIDEICAQRRGPVFDRVRGRLNLALARYFQQIGDIDEASSHAALAVALYPESMEANVYQAGLLLRRGEAQNAITYVQAASRLRPLAVGIDALEIESFRQLNAAYGRKVQGSDAPD